jgi:hypothetical protein
MRAIQSVVLAMHPSCVPQAKSNVLAINIKFAFVTPNRAPFAHACADMHIQNPQTVQSIALS